MLPDPFAGLPHSKCYYISLAAENPLTLTKWPMAVRCYVRNNFANERPPSFNSLCYALNQDIIVTSVSSEGASMC